MFDGHDHITLKRDRPAVPVANACVTIPPLSKVDPEVDLILWRHAEAEPGEPDLGRRLTSKGLKQAERMGEWLDH